MRFIFATLCIVALIAPAFAFHGGLHFAEATPAFPKARNGVIYLDYMPGGIVGEHLRQAQVWLDRGYRVEIRDDQYSAAAMMAVYFKNGGGKICVKRGVNLHFHLLSNGAHPAVVLGKGDKKRIGPVTYRFKKISPSVFGIPLCV